MPELPEVETIRRQLAPARRGPAARSTWRCWTRAGPTPRRPRRSRTPLAGAVIERLGRRGKYLIASLEDDVHLVMHLRMTGQPAAARRRRGARSPARGVRARRRRQRLLFVDVRRFGTGDVLLGSDALDDYFDSRLGVEPLEPGLHRRGAARAGAGAAGSR